MNIYALIHICIVQVQYYFYVGSKFAARYLTYYAAVHIFV